jgi:hypothetical protein
MYPYRTWNTLHVWDYDASDGLKTARFWVALMMNKNNKYQTHSRIFPGNTRLKRHFCAPKNETPEQHQVSVEPHHMLIQIACVCSHTECEKDLVSNECVFLLAPVRAAALIAFSASSLSRAYRDNLSNVVNRIANTLRWQQELVFSLVHAKRSKKKTKALHSRTKRLFVAVWESLCWN